MTAKKGPWSYSYALRMVNKARNFPTNTDGCSRHAVGIAEDIKRRGLEIAECDAEHVAVSILVTVESLWKLRTEHAAIAARASSLEARVINLKHSSPSHDNNSVKGCILCVAARRFNAKHGKGK